MQEIRYALRMVRKNFGFTALAILMLGLGIGVTTTIFTAVNDFLLRPLPFRDADRIVTVLRYSRKFPESGTNDPPTFEYWREHNRVFEDIAAWSVLLNYLNLTGAERPERIPAMQVSAAFFRVLGVNPALGRTFADAEDQAGANRVVVISHSLWQARFGGNIGILGKTLVLDGEDYTVIGVLPAGFHFSTRSEQVWIPLRLPGLALTNGHGSEFLYVIARLRRGMTMTRAQADLEAITTPWARQFPDWSNGNQWIAVESLRDRYDRELRPALLPLLVAAALVLLIACANLANLLLARTGARRKEIAMRRVLGASGARIISQALSESSIVAVLGGSTGLLMAFFGTRIFYAALPGDWLPIGRRGIDATVLAFTVLTLIVTVFLIGMVPAYNAIRFDLNESLKDHLRSPLVGMGRRSFQAAVVAGEVALATLLLTGTALLVKSSIRLSTVNLGFSSENLLTVDLARTGKDVNGFYQDLIDRITDLPHIVAAGAINFKPLYSGPSWYQDITIEGRPSRDLIHTIYAGHRSVTLGYVSTMRIPLLKGRLFVATDQDKRVALVSESMARHCWPGEDPVGKRFGINCSDSPCNWDSVIGVVGDVREDGATGEPAITMYLLEMAPSMTLVVRSDENPTMLIGLLRSIIHSVDPEQAIGGIQTLGSIASELAAPRRLAMLISTVFVALALPLAMVGLYGVLAYTVDRRSHEIGIRMALGATKGDILALIVAQGLGVALAGIVTGIAGALALQEVLKSLLFGISPTDPITFGEVAILLICISLLACYIPARRASKAEPLVALRHE